MRFIESKQHILYSVERQMNVNDLWREGASLLDVGTGQGYVAAYLQAVHGTRIVGYEVGSTGQCADFLRSPFRLAFMTHEANPRVPEPPRSFDAVSFMNVLHHAAERTPALLAQAAEHARKYITWHIIVVEDLCTRRSSRHCQWLRTKHDTLGIFRNNSEWQQIFHEHCAGFRLARWGHVPYKVVLREMNHSVPVDDPRAETVIGLKGHIYSMAFYVLERV
tara:strand:+ start:1507 stop:2169 length:663 start_codon:yes stop_codon:yes gene_type:complete